MEESLSKLKAYFVWIPWLAAVSNKTRYVENISECTGSAGRNFND